MLRWGSQFHFTLLEGFGVDLSRLQYIMLDLADPMQVIGVSACVVTISGAYRVNVCVAV